MKKARISRFLASFLVGLGLTGIFWLWGESIGFNFTYPLKIFWIIAGVAGAVASGNPHQPDGRVMMLVLFVLFSSLTYGLILSFSFFSKKWKNNSQE